MTSKKVLTTLLVALSFAASDASAQTITFDDIGVPGGITALGFVGQGFQFS